MKPRTACELCKGEAALHCESDSAFLCWVCDARVHGANFLVARHVRRLVCPECHSVDGDHVLSGAGFRPIGSPCRTCRDAGGPDHADDSSSSTSLSSSCSSSCVSSAESAPAARLKRARVEFASVPTEGDRPIEIRRTTDESGLRRAKGRRNRRAEGKELNERAEGVLVDWCRRLGLDGGAALGVASHVLCVGLRKATAPPFRVCVAGSVWFAAKMCGGSREEEEGERPGGAGRRRRIHLLLRELEACSGVPARLIVAAESRLSRALTRRHGEEGEGWAECP